MSGEPGTWSDHQVQTDPNLTRDSPIQLIYLCAQQDRTDSLCRHFRHLSCIPHLAMHVSVPRQLSKMIPEFTDEPATTAAFELPVGTLSPP